MITIEDIKTKGCLELINVLIEDIKNGELRQLLALEQFLEIGLSGPDKAAVVAVLDNLSIYCQQDITKENSAHKFWMLGFKHFVMFDFSRAIEYYELAIALDYIPALSNRAFMHANGTGGAVNYPEAIRLSELAINAGNVFAMNNRAYMHANGIGGAVNYPEAFRLYELAISAGHVAAMLNRALMHKNGIGGAVNNAEAIRLYELAINAGNLTAMNHRAFMHENSIGGPADLKKAARLFRQSFEITKSEGIRKKLRFLDNVYYVFHLNMINNDIAGVVALFCHHFDSSLGEFIEYDCAKNLDDPEHLARIKNVLAGCSGIDSLKKSKLFSSVLMVLDAWEKRKGGSEEIAFLKVKCLEALDYSILESASLIPVLRLVVDTWYSFDGFTSSAAKILNKLVCRLSIIDENIDSVDLKNTALILIQNMFGADYTLALNAELASYQVMYLFACTKDPRFSPVNSKQAVAEINRFLGGDVIIAKQASALSELSVFAVGGGPSSLGEQVSFEVPKLPG